MLLELHHRLHIQVFGPDGSQCDEQIPGSNHSFHFTGLQLIPLQGHTYCVTAKFFYDQIDLKLTVNFTELQGGLKFDSIVLISQW